MLVAGSKMLEVNKESVNALNVFPVPDGDTGTNMSLTMISAMKEVCKNTTNTMEALCQDLTKGALRGARGNSGRHFVSDIEGLCQCGFSAGGA